MIKYLCYLYLPLLLISCAAKHNVPITEKPNKITNPNKVSIFVDQNGNFYPNNWKNKFGEPPNNAKRNVYSLMKNATEGNYVNDLIVSENEFIKAVNTFNKNKKRVFILIHGFNASEKNASKSYKQLQNKININTKNDVVIEFFWDGLISESLLGGAKIWFDATNYSQFAGELGLRRILNGVKKSDVYLISHSRGASVILSALTTAEIDESLNEETKEVHNVDLENDSKNLLENNNKYYAILLAPAIGISDFQIKSDSIEAPIVYRYFTKQLKVIHITNNNTDKLLGKFVGFLADKLKPTDLGYKSDTFEKLKKHYSIIKMTDFSGMKSHKFDDYITNEKFAEILSQYNLLKK